MITLDRKDAVIAALCLVLAFQFVIGALLTGAMVHMRATSISVADADRMMRLVEHVQSVNELCVGLRVRAEQTMMADLGMGEDDDDGKVRHKAADAGARLRTLRDAAGGPREAR